MGSTKFPPMIRAVQAAILLFSIGAYAISFEQIRLAAIAIGTSGTLAIIYGLLAEGFVSLALYTAWTARGTRLAIYPWAVTIAGFAFSLWANARNSRDVGEAVLHSFPVVMVPIGVHLLIVLMEAHRRRMARLADVMEDAPEPEIVYVPAEPQVITETVEVPVEVPITPDTINPEMVENPKAVAYRLLEYYHERQGNRGQVSYSRRMINEALAGVS